MTTVKRDERGQAMVEMAIIITALFFLTIGLVTVAIAFYQYNALAAGARYGARWAAVVGGTCTERQSDQPDPSTGDWCDQYLAASGTSFWNQTGTYPLQSPGPTTTCPTSYTSSSTYTYKVGTYATSGGTSIAGSIAQHFDTSSGSYFDSIAGGYLPALDLTQLYVCVQPAYSTTTSGRSTTYSWQFGPGEPVKVVLYYKFTPVSGLLGSSSLNLVASSTYVTQ